jgi:hypothetical protein
MHRPARILNRLTHLLALNRDLDPGAKVEPHIPGWSTVGHQLFFAAILAEPSIRRVLVCGVYHGLDLLLLARAAAQLGRTVELTGVDLFSAAPCADWPAAKRHLTWEQAFGCPPPSREAAQKNCPAATLVTARSTDFLRDHAGKFDAIFLDTSHDYDTVSSEIGYAMFEHAGTPLLLCGDDYVADGGFEGGVSAACDCLLPGHLTAFSRLWLAEV